jgi:O-antigen/teichoic acid export membrane protein
MVLVTIIAAAAGGILTKLWTGRADISAAPSLYVTIGIYFVLRVWTDTHTTVLYSIGAQGEVLKIAILHALLSLTLSVLLGRTHGALGVAVANVLGFALTASWFITWRARLLLAEVRHPPN